MPHEKSSPIYVLAGSVVEYEKEMGIFEKRVIHAALGNGTVPFTHKGS